MMRIATCAAAVVLALSLLSGWASRADAQEQPFDAPPIDPRTSPAARGNTDWHIGDDLVRTRWHLVEMDGQAVAAGTAPTLEFLRDLQVRGTTGCRRYVGPFASRADKGVFGPLRVAEASCEGELAPQDASYLRNLRDAWLMRLEDDGKVLLAFPRGRDTPLRFARDG